MLTPSPCLDWSTHPIFQTAHSVSYHPPIQLHDCHITIKRLDKIHPTISGNKLFKLKYNLEYAIIHELSPIISFGGAYSNHIHALAHACHSLNLASIGIIRGQELADRPLNHTLSTAKKQGMHLDFISREEYRRKNSKPFLDKLRQQYPNAYIIAEGGTNQLAIQGTEEILTEEDKRNYDLICLAVGTGGTMAGIINASSPTQQVLGFSALNTSYQQTDLKSWTNKNNWQLFADDVFAGYAKTSPLLLDFIDNIQQKYHVPLEPVYTGKALYRLCEMINNQQITNQNILFIHTGGLQAFQQQ